MRKTKDGKMIKKKEVDARTTCLCLSPGSTTMYLGLENGKLVYFRRQKKLHEELQKKLILIGFVGLEKQQAQRDKKEHLER